MSVLMSDSSSRSPLSIDALCIKTSGLVPHGTTRLAQLHSDPSDVNGTGPVTRFPNGPG